MKSLKPKTKKWILNGVRAGIQVLFFLFLPSAFSSAFAGIKYVFTQFGIGTAVGWVPFIQVLLLLCIFTAIFGRFFCGFACAFGSLGDWLHELYLWICRRMKKKPWKLPTKIAKGLSYIKYGILLGIVLSCYLGVYQKFGAWNPWNVFSLLRARNFHLSGFVPGLIILILILIGMTLCERFFCRFLCPMGAIFSLLPTLPLFRIRRDRSACLKGCNLCQRTCPAEIVIQDQCDRSVNGECFQCQKCIGVCPKHNTSGTRMPLRGNEIWLTVCKAMLLAGLLVLIGVG